VSLALYRGATRLVGPLVDRYLDARLARGKEDPQRLGERRGIASRPRPAGFLAWVHAASVGEAVSALSLVDRLIARGSVLLTTGTVTSGQIMSARLPEGALHQYVPVDRPDWVARFLDHWRPDLGLWLESELWPNLVTATAARGTPMVLVNARMSERSASRWRWLPWTIRPLLDAFDLCLAQSEESASRFRALGALRVEAPGNLKFAAPPLPVDEAELARLRAVIGDRPCWLAASTHPGEEALAGRVHEALAARHPRLLTLIAPRHPARGSDIAAALPGRVTRRTAGEGPTGDIYVADTLGELGLFYRVAPVVLIGKSMLEHGGHNPLEPARLGAAVLHGPNMQNFIEAVALLGDALTPIAGEAELVAAVDRLLADPAQCTSLGALSRERATRGGNALDAVMAALTPYLPPLPGNARA
jgi:3-deoxy-D-manno-octulosonic-acid transferase